MRSLPRRLKVRLGAGRVDVLDDTALIAGICERRGKTDNGRVKTTRLGSVVTLVAFLGACTNGGSGQSARSSSPAPVSTVVEGAPATPSVAAPPAPTTARASGSAVTAARRCAAGELRLTAGQDLGSLMQQPAAYFGLTNTAAAPCKVLGYPSVAFFDGAGHRISAEERRGTTYQINDPGPAEVTLAPGVAGWFGVGWIAVNMNGDRDGCVDPAAVGVVPPGGGRQMRIPVRVRAAICPRSGLIVTAVALRASFPLADPAA